MDIKEIIEKKYKYECEKCRFKCNTKAQWEAHINTTLHQTGERKKRSDIKEPFKCAGGTSGEKCEYKTKNKTTLKQHYLNDHGTLEEREKEFKCYCKVCDFGTFSIDIYKNHIESEKHKKKSLRMIKM